MDSNLKHNTVTVLMPVYNGQLYLKEAIESVLNQTFTQFNFLIINDGSTDNSLKILTSYLDNRITIVNNDFNLGLINTLNKGLDLVNTNYIVRMDCDDVCEPNRLATQVTFMNQNPNIAASGSFIWLCKSNKKRLLTEPRSVNEIKPFLLFNTPIAHPTAIIRNDILKKHQIKYSQNHTHAEDYQLWIDILKFGDVVNLPKPLLNYRVHQQQITSTQSTSNLKTNTLNLIRNQELINFGITPNTYELQLHNMIANGEKKWNTVDFDNATNWLNKLITHNKSKLHYDLNYFHKIILERYLRLCINFFGIKKGLIIFYKSEIRKTCLVDFKIKIELIFQFYYSFRRLHF